MHLAYSFVRLGFRPLLCFVGLQKQDIRFRGRLNLPATGGEQHAKGLHIPRDPDRNGGSLLPLFRKRLLGFRE